MSLVCLGEREIKGGELMDAAIYVVLGLLLGAGLVTAGMLLVSSGIVGKRQQSPVNKP
jgi:hypothetical protein